MILDYIELPITKENFTISKINGTNYKSNIGNFYKHLTKYGYTLESYTTKYYAELMPRCLETGDITDNKITGYWNRYIPISTKFKQLAKKVKILENAITHIKEDQPEYYTKYLDFNYWLSNGLKLSDAYDKIAYFITKNRSTKLYMRLADSFYDDSWSMQCKTNMIDSILNGNAMQLYSRYSKKGAIQRGNISTAELDSYYKTRPTTFRDKALQRKNSAKRQAKYSKLEQRKFTVTCIEYWISKGYNENEARNIISDRQRKNSIEQIMDRHNCTYTDAVNIQADIYNRRLVTIQNKPQHEQDYINSKKDSGSFDYCLRKCNNDHSLALVLYNELKRKRCVPAGKASKESLKYFIPLYKILRKNGYCRQDIFFGISGSSEYWLKDISRKLFYLYDFTILSQRIIFEYDGIKWHDESNLQHDLDKTALAESNGFTVIRIKSDWSDEMKFNIIKTVLNDKMQINNTNW